MPNVLLVYPKFPLSYWGFQFAMDFVGRKAFMPPLGLVTVAGMFPRDSYTLRVVDMNVETLTDTHLAWADVVMTSTMIVQTGIPLRRGAAVQSKRDSHCRWRSTPHVLLPRHQTGLRDKAQNRSLHVWRGGSDLFRLS